MATSPVDKENASISTYVESSLPLVPLTLAMFIAIFLSVTMLGGAGYYLIHSARLSLVKAKEADLKPSVTAKVATHAMVLDPMVANLADASGAAYLKLSLTLKVADEPSLRETPAKEEKPSKGMNEAEAAVRDTVLAVIGQQSANSLLASDGKEKLKSGLRAALAEHNPDLKVTDLFFTDFLVQR